MPDVHPTETAAGGVCPFCLLAFEGRPNQCGRCGTLLNEAAADVRRLGAQARRRIRTRRAFADLLFLVGLLLGGPMMTIGGDLRLGLFIALAGGLASALRRYTDWSALGAILVGAVGAAVVAATVVDTPRDADEERAGVEARAAYAEPLAAADPDVLVEGRGEGLVAIWFTIPAERSEECGDYPPAEVRLHLADLGFARVVVSERNQSGGLCSFSP